MIILRGKNLAKKIGARQIFRKLSLEVAEGRLALVTGPNGSGKSLLLLMLAGAIPPSGGFIEYGDKGRPRISYAPTVRGLDEFLSVRSNISSWQPDMESVDRELRMWGLDALASEPVESLSSGMRKRVLLARAFSMRKSNLFLLDEPMESLDAKYRTVFREEMKGVLQAGAGMVVATHEAGFYGEFDPVRVELESWD